MNFKKVEQNLLSNFQSNICKLVNNLDKNNLDQVQFNKLIKINESIEKINIDLLNLNESFKLNYLIDKRSLNNITIDKDIESIYKDNKTLEDLLPLFLLYRMYLDSN